MRGRYMARRLAPREWWLLLLYNDLIRKARYFQAAMFYLVRHMVDRRPSPQKEPIEMLTFRNWAAHTWQPTHQPTSTAPDNSKNMYHLQHVHRHNMSWKVREKMRGDWFLLIIQVLCKCPVPQRELPWPAISNTPHPTCPLPAARFPSVCFIYIFLKIGFIF